METCVEYRCSTLQSKFVAVLLLQLFVCAAHNFADGAHCNGRWAFVHACHGGNKRASPGIESLSKSQHFLSNFRRRLSLPRKAFEPTNILESSNSLSDNAEDLSTHVTDITRQIKFSKLASQLAKLDVEDRQLEDDQWPLKSIKRSESHRFGEVKVDPPHLDNVDPIWSRKTANDDVIEEGEMTAAIVRLQQMINRKRLLKQWLDEERIYIEVKTEEK